MNSNDIKSIKAVCGTYTRPCSEKGFLESAFFIPHLYVVLYDVTYDKFWDRLKIDATHADHSTDVNYLNGQDFIDDKLELFQSIQKNGEWRFTHEDVFRVIDKRFDGLRDWLTVQ